LRQTTVHRHQGIRTQHDVEAATEVLEDIGKHIKTTNAITKKKVGEILEELDTGSSRYQFSPGLPSLIPISI